MAETSANRFPDEPGPAPERLPRWSIGVSAVLGALWLLVVFGAPWLAEPVSEIANDIDLRYGLWSKARPPADDD